MFTIISGDSLGHHKNKNVLFDFLLNFTYRLGGIREERHLVCFLLFVYFQETVTLKQMPN